MYTIYRERCPVEKKKKRLVVIDGKSVFYRGYYAMPNLSMKDGTPTGGVYGFAVMAIEVIKRMDPDFVAVAWDKPKTNIRRRTDIYPEYKANRKPAPPDFYEQVPVLNEMLAAFSWPLYEIDDHEADDIMGTFAKQAEDKDYETVLITSDHDVLQLVSDLTTVAVLRKGLTNVEYFTPKHFEEYYHMTPDQFIDYKSLRGDPSDNLPGVAGVGEKTATQLIEEYKTLDGVYEHLDDIKPTLSKKLSSSKDLAYITQKLVTLDKEVPIKLNWKKADIKSTDPAEIIEKLRELEFRTLIKQLPEDMQVSAEDIQEATKTFASKAAVTLVDSDSDLGKVDLSGEQLVLHCWSTGAHGDGLQYILISNSPKKAYLFDMLKLDNESFSSSIKSILENEKVQKLGFNMKTLYKALKLRNIELKGVANDLQMSAFLVNPLIREQSLTKLAQDTLGYEGEELDNVPPEDVPHIAPNVAGASWGIHEDQVKEFKKLPELKKLAEEIEWPLIPVLADMEMAGVRLDTEYLKVMSKELEDSISDLEQEIYGHANQEFNISSPAQLGSVLFEGLGLPTQGVKRNKTGYSTAAPELAKLRSKHPIIDLISDYRELTKLKSTYVDALPKLVDENSKLHTTFSTSVAPTGRLSSSDPNVQNIPIRSEIGRKIRKAFVPSTGKIFVQADYSQFELRLAATMANDTEWIELFNDGVDVHTRTAAQVYGEALEDVTKDQRRNAKIINFGVLYGMSPHGLSVATGMSPKQAKEFIDKYFALRKPVREYLDKLKDQAHDDGYVETMFGRRRPTPDVKSSNFVVRAAAERAALNLPFQGTEADLMKMAMIELDKKLPEEATQLLQVHDSILVECPVGMADEIGAMMKETMEKIRDVGIKLDVDVSKGKHWGDL